jgi:DNA-binding MarR family transcriptional regulator
MQQCIDLPVWPVAFRYRSGAMSDRPPASRGGRPVADRTGRPRSRRPPSPLTLARTFEADLSAPVLAASTRVSNPRQISERIAMGRALWRELVIGFATQLGELRLGFTQLAALYVLAEGRTTTVGDLAEAIGRSPSATSRLVDGLVRRRLVERRDEVEDRRQRTLWLTPRGRAVLRVVDQGRAQQFLDAVRPLPSAERRLIAMGVAALATGAISRRGRLIRGVRD